MPENFATFLAAHQWIIILAAVWTIPWKGVALWRAARNRSVAWFVVLLVINTLGILDILYIFAFSKKREAEVPQPIEPEKMILGIKQEEKDNEKKEEKKSALDEEASKS